MATKNCDLEQVDLFVAQLIRDEQDNFAKLHKELGEKIIGTREYDDVVRILERILHAKIEVLEKVHKKIQSY